MILIDDDKLRLLCGKPLIFKDTCLVYSPILEDIISVGLSKFYKDISLLLIEKPSVEEKEVNDVLKELSDLRTQKEEELETLTNRWMELEEKREG